MSLKQFYSDKSQIPTEFETNYKLNGDKYELQIEGVNSIAAVLAKNTELLGKNATLTREKEEAETAKAEAEARAEEFKMKPNVPKGQKLVSVEKAELADAAEQSGLSKVEFANLKTENDAFKTLGAIADIKAKLEGYDAAITTANQAVKDKALMAAGIDPNKARLFKAYDGLEIEAEAVGGKETFSRITRDDKGKEKRTAFDGDYLKTAEDLKDVFTAEPPNTKLFRQGTNTLVTNKYDAIKEKVKAQNDKTGGASFEDKFFKRTNA